MKIKTSELTGAALDWAVAKCEGRSAKGMEKIVAGTNLIPADYSTDWAQGGPIIERDDLNVTRLMHSGVTESGQEVYRKEGWTASTTPGAYWMTPTRQYGPTPLIAAMRCVVASKLGEEVEVPDELHNA